MTRSITKPVFGWLLLLLLLFNLYLPVKAQTTREVVEAEYFWDTDPGQGAGTPMLVFDGSFDDAVESLFASGIAIPAPVGPHTFNVRIQDAENNWSPVFTTVINSLELNLAELLRATQVSLIVNFFKIVFAEDGKQMNYARSTS